MRENNVKKEFLFNLLGEGLLIQDLILQRDMLGRLERHNFPVALLFAAIWLYADPCHFGLSVSH